MAALAVIRRELEAIAAMPGGDEKTSDIRDLAKAISDLWDMATEIRTGEMFRIYDEEKLSLAPLADRVGVSKGGAHRQIQKRRQEKEKRDG